MEGLTIEIGLKNFPETKASSNINYMIFHSCFVINGNNEVRCEFFYRKLKCRLHMIYIHCLKIAACTYSISSVQCAHDYN